VERVHKLYEALRQGRTEEFRNASRRIKLTAPARAEEYKHKNQQTAVQSDCRRDEQQGHLLK